VYSTHTRQEAEDLRTLTCSRSYDGEWWIFPGVIEGGVEFLPEAGDQLEKLHGIMALP
jgi:hypothetical protein